MALNYKEEFQKTPFAKGWTDLMDSQQFQAGAQAALLHFHASIDQHSDMASAAASEWRRQGAQQYLRILIGLSINPQRPQPAIGQQLDYKV